MDRIAYAVCRMQLKFHKALCPLIWLFMLGGLLCACEEQPTEQTASPEPSSVKTEIVSAQEVERLPYPEVGRRGGTRTLGNTSLPTSFNPYLASDAGSQVVLQQLFQGLVSYDALQRKLVPALAESWQHNAAQTEWTFKLRPGLKWSDGKPLTSADVLFTYHEIINNPQIPNNYRDFWSYLSRFPELSAPDPQTVRLVVEKPFAPLLYNLMAPVLPQHILKASLQPDSQQRLPFFRAWGLNVKPEQLVSNGPWRLAGYQPGQRVTLERNPHYYQKDPQGQQLPYLDKMVLLDMQDAQTAMLRFRNGELDTYLMNPPDYDLLAAEQQKRKFSIYNLGPNPSSLFVMFNMSRAIRPNQQPVVDPVKAAWFRDPVFRQALALAIDKQGLIDSVYKGRAVPQFSHLNLHNPFYNPALTDYGYDMAEARKLLKAAGYSWTTKNQLLDPRRKPVGFELTTNVSSSERDATCAVLRKTWAQLGINVTYKPTHQSVLIKRIHETYDWEVMLMGLASNSLEPHFSASRWKLDGRMHLFNMGHPSYWKGRPTQYEPWEQELENLYLEAAHETDFAKRKALYFKAQDIERTHLPFIYTVSELDLVAVSNRIGNIRPSVYGGSGLHQVNWNSEWHYLKTPKDLVN